MRVPSPFLLIACFCHQLPILVDFGAYGSQQVALSPMTVDAEGIRVYGNLSSAKIVNSSAYVVWNALEWLSFDGRLSYAIGKDNTGNNLHLSRLSAIRQQPCLTTANGMGRWQ